MIGPETDGTNRMMKSLSAMLTGLFMIGATLPALAEGAGESSNRGRVPEAVANGTERSSDLLLAHKVKLRLPSALIGDEDAQTPKFSIELGYGRSLPPLLGMAAPMNLPKEFGGRTDQSAIKANVTMGF